MRLSWYDPNTRTGSSLCRHSRRQAVLHSLYEVSKHPLCLSSLLVSILRGHVEALSRGSFEVPPEGVTARKEVPTVVAKGYFKRMCFCCPAVPLEIIPVAELTVGHLIMSTALRV
jgi:hypothetical protein